MKTLKSIILGLTVVLVLDSCTVSTYYQVFSAEGKNLNKAGNNLYYEDNNCKIIYNLWGPGGNAGFKVYNKTENILYLHLDNCFFVVNGQANNYFQNRIFTSGTSKGVSSSKSVSSIKSTGVSVKLTGVDYYGYQQQNSLANSSFGTSQLTRETTSSSSYSVSKNEERVISIPPRTFKEITEFSIANTMFRDCNLFLYPTKRENNRMSFDINSSPLVFGNRIAYSLKMDSELIILENNFFVKEIVNHSEKDIVTIEEETFCGEKKPYKKKYFKQTHPDQFYIQYKKSGIIWRH